MKGIFVFVVFNLFFGLNAELNSVNLPENILDYLLGCSSRMSRSRLQNLDPLTTKKTGENFEMLDVGKMRSDLMQTIDNEEIITKIITQIEKTMEEHKRGRQGCTSVTIDVAPQEVKGLNEQMQAVIQQNNRILLEQVHTLFRLKLDSTYNKIEQMMDAKLTAFAQSITSAQQTEEDSTLVPETMVNLERMTETQPLEDATTNVESQPDAIEVEPIVKQAEDSQNIEVPPTQLVETPSKSLKMLSGRPAPLIRDRKPSIEATNVQKKENQRDTRRSIGGLSRMRSILLRRRGNNLRTSRDS